MSLVMQLNRVAATFGTKGSTSGTEFAIAGLFFIALMSLAALLELGQLAFGVVGAVVYALVQASRKSAQKSLKSGKGAKGLMDVKCEAQEQASPKARPARRAPAERRGGAARSQAAKLIGKQEYRQSSSQPVVAPSFETDDFEGQVQELARQLAPTREGEELVRTIAAQAKAALEKLIPEAEVMGFASADVLRGTAFAVAIPEVDITLSASPGAMAEALQNRFSRPLPHAAKLDARKLQKSMLRACTDELTLAPCFKFRRSAFKGQEPKVTLMAKSGGKAVPVDFSVNAVAPLYNAALLTECGQIDARAKELILLVRRWAKDRGVSHAAKGHLSPYAWSILAIFFLQVWDTPEGHLLPGLTAFKVSSGLLQRQRQRQRAGAPHDVNEDVVPPRPPAGERTTPAQLLAEFLRFYAETFPWRSEAVSVRAGRRGPPAQALPLNIVTLDTGAVEVALSIEDPFEPRQNLSNCMTGMSYQRLKEELSRGAKLTARRATLEELLEPWVPPERAEVGGSRAGAATEVSSEGL